MVKEIFQKSKNWRKLLCYLLLLIQQRILKPSDCQKKELIYWAQDFEPEADIDTVDEAVNSLEENDFVVDRVM